MVASIRPGLLFEKLRAIADTHGLKIIEDSAQAAGAIHNGRKAGALGDANGMSLYPSKTLERSEMPELLLRVMMLLRMLLVHSATTEVVRSTTINIKG